MKQSRLGECRTNKTGDKMVLIYYGSSSDILVQFQDSNAAIVHTTYSSFSRGQVKNPYGISVFGTGCIGDGPHKSKENGKPPANYLMWLSMLQRCYAEKWKKKFPAYYGICTVCSEWLNFQNFADWYCDNYYETNERLHLDKDIICPGNTEYAPDKCLLVPQRINMLFTKKNKAKAFDQKYRDHIIDVADAYKDIVPDSVYSALIRRANY